MKNPKRQTHLSSSKVGQTFLSVSAKHTSTLIRCINAFLQGASAPLASVCPHLQVGDCPSQKTERGRFSVLASRFSPLTTISSIILLASLLILHPQPATSQSIVTSDTATTKPIFEIKDGEVHIPAIDDRGPSQPLTLLKITAEEFPKPAHIYRGRVILERGDIMTSPIVIPLKATSLHMLLRSRVVEDEFPHLRVSAIPATATTPETQLYSGFAQTLSMDTITIPIPETLHGQPARIKITLTNPAVIHDRRAVYIGHISFQ